MSNAIPPGYRPVTVGDNLWKLNAAHKLTSQCRCTHLEADHVGHIHHGQCDKCDCKKFTWTNWLVQLETEPAPEA